MFHWMEAIAIVNSSLKLKILKPSSTTKKLLIAVGAFIVGLDVTASFFDVYGISGASVLVVGIVYSSWSLLMAGVSLYTSYKLRGAIAKIWSVAGGGEQMEVRGKSKTVVTTAATDTGTAVTGGGTRGMMKDATSAQPSVIVRYGKGTPLPGTSPASDGNKVPREKGILHKSKGSGQLMLGIGEKLQGVLFYVNISAYLLIVAVVASLLMALDVRFTSTTSLAIVSHLPLFLENGISLSDIIIIAKSMDSTNK
jgi:hypothetical protein